MGLAVGSLGMGVATSLPMTTSLRVAAVGDLHCTRTSEGVYQPLFAKIAESADVLVLCGDLTDYGTSEEARVLAKDLSALKLPKVAVLGNHDFESNAADEVSRILTDAAGVVVLDGTAVEIPAWASRAPRASRGDSEPARCRPGARRR